MIKQEEFLGELNAILKQRDEIELDQRERSTVVEIVRRLLAISYQEVEAGLAQLKSERDEARGKVAELRIALESANNHGASLQQKLEETVRDADRSYADQAGKIIELEGALESAIQNYTKLFNENQITQYGVNSKSEEVERLKEQLKQADFQINQTCKRLIEVERTLKETQAGYEHLAQRHAKDLSELHTTIEVLAARVAYYAEEGE